jgi:hypothetical protein
MFSESDLAELETWPYEVLGRAAIFMRSGYSYKPKENRQFSSMSSGPPTSRLMSTHIIADHSGKLELLDGELSYFEWWYANKINHGNDYFKINLMTGAGFNTVVAKFAKNGKGAATIKGMRYTLNCKLIVIELPTLALTEQEAIALANSGTFKLQLASNELKQVVHEDW